MNRNTISCWSSVSATVAVWLAPTVNAAEGLDYTWLQLEGIGRDIDAFDDDKGLIEDFNAGSGFGITGSWEFSDNIFVFGGYSETDSDVTFSNTDNFPLPAKTDISRLEFGIGGIVAMNDRVDLVGDWDMSILTMAVSTLVRAPISTRMICLTTLRMAISLKVS